MQGRWHPFRQVNGYVYPAASSKISAVLLNCTFSNLIPLLQYRHAFKELFRDEFYGRKQIVLNSPVATFSARFSTRPVAALEVIEEHVVLAADFHGRGRVVAQLSRDGIGHDPKTLPEFVHEAKRKFAMAHKGADKKKPWRRGAFVGWGEKRAALSLIHI